MINEITIEGIVTREPWSYDKDVFFRVACYRDMDLPAKPDISSPGRDELDYVNIRNPGGAGTMFSVQKGQRVRVNGFLQSREFKEGLIDLVEKARKNGHIEIKLSEDSGLELASNDTRADLPFCLSRCQFWLYVRQMQFY